MGRPRHPVKELEAVLREAESRGWRVTKGKLYFKLLCPCAKKHIKTVHLTPSSSKYEINLRNFLSHYTCWEQEGKQ
jgi:hypothetical protein